MQEESACGHFCVSIFWSDKDVEAAVLPWFQHQTRHYLLEMIHRLIV